MISVKEYAEARGITIQAVHQSMKGKQKAALLKGHVTIEAGVKYLDDEAVEILDRDRHKSQYLIEKEDNGERIKQLETENEALRAANLIYANKIANQASELSELYKKEADNAKLIEAANNQLLLAEKSEKVHADELKRLETQKDLDRDRALFDLRKELEADHAGKEVALKQIIDDAAKRAEQLNDELEAEKNRKLSFSEAFSRWLKK